MEIECHCQEVFAVEIPDEYNLDESPELLNEILTAQFWKFICPHCKNEIKVEEKVFFKYPTKDIYIAFIPEKDKNQYFLGNYNLKKSINRVVIGYKELVEKLVILKESKDEKIIELLKFTFLQKSKDRENLKIYYKGQTADKLEFYIDGLKQDEIGLTSIPYNAYIKVCESFLTNWNKDWDSFLTPPYIQANQLTWEP